MSLQLAGVLAGINIDDQVHVIPSDGVPSSARHDVAPKGSLAPDYTNGVLYFKTQDGAGVSAWEDIRLASTDSWREPVVIKDDTVYPDLAAATTAVSSGPLQTVTLADSERILFTAITGEAGNIYTYSGGALVEDANSESNGDHVYVEQGTSAGVRFVYNGVNWGTDNATSLDELGYIRTFIGKLTEGSNTPTYPSTEYVVNGSALATAIGTLDAQVKANADAVALLQTFQTNIQSEVDTTQLSVGLNTDGTLATVSGTNYLDGVTTILAGLLLLDTAIDSSATDVTNLQNEVDAIELGAGLSTTGTYVQPSGSNYLDTTTSLYTAILALDAQAFSNASEISTLQTFQTNIQTEVDNIETASGLNTDGTFPPHSGTTYLDGATSLYAVGALLDAQVKANADAIIALQATSGDEANIRAFIGKDAAGGENPAYSSILRITQGTPLESALGELDAFTNVLHKRVAVSGISGSGQVVDVDSETLAAALAVEWRVHITDTVTGRSQYTVVHSATNGTAVDSAGVPVLRPGGKINQLAIEAVATASGHTLQVSAGLNPVDVVAVRSILI